MRSRQVTPDELAAIGRPRMLRHSLITANAMRPDLAPRVERLARCVTPCDDEARFWALKIVWRSAEFMPGNVSRFNGNHRGGFSAAE